MTMMAPLTEIAATPRKEMDSKFKFNNQPSVHKVSNNSSIILIVNSLFKYFCSFSIRI